MSPSLRLADDVKRDGTLDKERPLAHMRPAQPERLLPALVERARRRRFTAEYKLRILREADACGTPGEIGALLRREGLYSSLLTEWRRQRERGSLAALDRLRGRPKADLSEAQIAALKRRLERAQRELGKARRVIELQENVSALLGESLKPRGAQGSTSDNRADRRRPHHDHPNQAGLSRARRVAGDNLPPAPATRAAAVTGPRAVATSAV